jgi:hypothetical protein
LADVTRGMVESGIHRTLGTCRLLEHACQEQHR